MKGLLKSYFSFSRTERIGLAILLSLLLALVLIRATMHYWVKTTPPVDHKELVVAWEAFKKQQIKQPPIAVEAPVPGNDDHNNYHRPAKPAFTGPVNINKADSAKLTSLKGIGPKLAQKIIKRRQEKGPFTSYEQLFEIRKFPEETFETLKKQVIFQ